MLEMSPYWCLNEESGTSKEPVVWKESPEGHELEFW